MTLQQLQERKDTLMKERRHHEGMCVALDGALQECDFWIQKVSSSLEAEQKEE